MTLQSCKKMSDLLNTPNGHWCTSVCLKTLLHWFYDPVCGTKSAIGNAPL